MRLAGLRRRRRIIIRLVMQNFVRGRWIKFRTVIRVLTDIFVMQDFIRRRRVEFWRRIGLQYRWRYIRRRNLSLMRNRCRQI